jgi:uncharacterized membrane protein
MDPFKQKDDVKPMYYIGQLLICILLGPIIVLVAILVPMLASHAQTTREMEFGIIALVLFTLSFAVLCFVSRR